MATRLVVTQEDKVGPEDETFVIDDELRQIRMDEWNDFYYELASHRIEDDGDIPLYGSLWRQFLLQPALHSPTFIGRAAFLYRKLADRVEETEPDVLVRSNVDEVDAVVVEEVAETFGLDVRGGESYSHSSVAAFMTMMVGLLPFFIDQLLSIGYRLVSDLPEQADTLFIPVVGRFESMRGVIEEADMNAVVLATPLTVVWKFRCPTPEMRRYDAIPINLFSSVRALARQLKYCFVRIGWREAVHGELTTELDQYLRDKHDIAIPRSIELSISQLYSETICRRILLGFVTDAAIRRLDAKQVAVGTGSMMGRAMLYAAERNGCDAYQIPHSVTNGTFVPITIDKKRFFPGTLPREFLEDEVPNYQPGQNDENIVPVGRPYLTELVEWVQENDSERSDERFRVVLATQPHEDHARAIFLETALGVAEQVDTQLERDVEVVIKTHPSEDVGYYVGADDRISLPVRVTDQNLRENLRDADLVLSINSNVGLESIITGTPTVSLNFWSPFITDLLYARYGPVPILRTESEVNEFFDGFTPGTVEDLLARQTAFVDEHFVIDPARKPAVEIAKEMESDLRAREM